MGGKQSSRQQQPEQYRLTEEQPTAAATSETPAATTGAAKPPAQETFKTYDVVISSTSDDKDTQLVSLIKGALESASVPCYSRADKSEAAAKEVGKFLVDAKVLIFVVSEHASKCGACQDQVSLAYISNKPILAVSEGERKQLLPSFQVGMKLTLQSLHWSVLQSGSDGDPHKLTEFVELIQAQLTNPTVVEQVEVVQTSVVGSAAPHHSTRRGGRLNTKLRAQSTALDMGETKETEFSGTNFWERNFPDLEDVAWFRFQQAFLTDYESKLAGLFDEDNIPWLLEMIKKEMFAGADKITKQKFLEARGDSKERNAFWKTVSQVAIEQFNMKEVFNMKSSVRLTAIERLSQFQSPAVIESLMTLLNDNDPNVRAVAAISLGRTGTTKEWVVDALIELLKDSDRIVRQSACLSLGAMKAVKAVPHIGNIWRNDFISVVRNAARTALEKMDVPEAKEVLKVTKILEEEIEKLEGGHTNV